MKKKFFVFFNILYLVFVLCYRPVDVHATVAAPAAAEIAQYFLSMAGAADLLSGGGIREVAREVRDNLTEKVADLIGSGIYENSNGEYVFSGEATQELYATLLGSNSLEARVVSDFGGNFPLSSLYHSGNQYLSNLAKSTMQQAIADTGYSSYLVALTLSEGLNGGNQWYHFQFKVMDLSTISFIKFDEPYQDGNSYYVHLRGCNAQGANQYIRFNWGRYQYNATTGEIRDMTIYNDSTTNMRLRFAPAANLKGDNIYFMDENVWTVENDFSPSSLTTHNAFSRFPFSGGGGSLFWSNRAVIVAENAVAAQNLLNQDSGIFIANYYDVLPAVNTNVINNNNWTSIYTQYIDNVSDEYEPGLTPDDLRNIMKRYVNSINNAIEQGTTDIENAISNTNKWLKKIFNVTNDILDEIRNNGGGGSSTDYSTLLNSIFAAVSNIETDVDYMKVDLTAIRNTASGIASDVDSIQSDVDSIQSDIDSIQTDTSNIASDVDSIQSDVDSIQSDTHNISIDIDAMESNIDTIEAATQNIASDVDTIQSDTSLIKQYTSNIGSMLQRLINIDTSNNSLLSDSDLMLQRLASTNVLLQQILDRLNEMDGVGGGGGGGGGGNTVIDTTITGMSGSSLMYPNVVNPNWNMGRADSTTYFHYFDIGGAVDVTINVSGSTRVRVIFTDTAPTDFSSQMANRTAFTLQGTFSAALSDNGVSDYDLENTSQSRYLFIYTGNAQGVTDVVTHTTSSDGGGGGIDVNINPDTRFNPTVNLPDLVTEVGIPDWDINAPWIKTQGIVTALEDTIPLCYLVMVGDLLQSLHSNPVAPKWEIPFRFTSSNGSGLSVDEKVILDFTGNVWATARNIWTGLWCFIFFVWLCYISFHIIGLISDLFT